MDLNLILSRLESGMDGHAKIYLEMEGANIHRDGDIVYLYNPYVGLWIKSPPFLVWASISLTMSRVINLAVEQLLRSTSFNHETLQGLHKWFSRTSQLSYCQEVWRLIPSNSNPLLLDRDPHTAFLLPIKGGHTLNLSTGKIRQRKRDDFFTRDCPVLYQSRPNVDPLDLTITLMVGAENVRHLQSLFAVCLTACISPFSMLVLCGPGRFQLADPLLYLLNHFHWRCRQGQLVHPEAMKKIEPSVEPLDFTRLLGVRCMTTLDLAESLDRIQVQALQNQGIKLIVLNSRIPKSRSIPGMQVIHVGSIKSQIHPGMLLHWLVDASRSLCDNAPKCDPSCIPLKSCKRPKLSLHSQEPPKTTQEPQEPQKSEEPQEPQEPQKSEEPQEPREPQELQEPEEDSEISSMLSLEDIYSDESQDVNASPQKLFLS
jgi:hypothetical protein